MSTSPQWKARIAGVFYMFTIVLGAIALAAGGGGLVFNLIATACYVAVTLVFYDLFRPVSPILSLLAAAVGLVGCALGALSSLGIYFLNINALVFFGLYCLLIGLLVFRSTFIPRAAIASRRRAREVAYSSRR